MAKDLVDILYAIAPPEKAERILGQALEAQHPENYLAVAIRNFRVSAWRVRERAARKVLREAAKRRCEVELELEKAYLALLEREFWEYVVPSMKLNRGTRKIENIEAGAYYLAAVIFRKAHYPKWDSEKTRNLAYQHKRRALLFSLEQDMSPRLRRLLENYVD